MARRHFLTSLGLSVLSAVALTGCVSQERYNAQKMRADQLAEQVGAAQAQVNSATATTSTAATSRRSTRSARPAPARCRSR
jgi:hypothetical protein